MRRTGQSEGVRAAPLGEQDPFSYFPTSEHQLMDSFLAAQRGREQTALETWHPGPLLRTQGTGVWAWDRCGDSCVLLSSPTQSSVFRVTQKQRLGRRSARVPTQGVISSPAKPVPWGPMERPDLWPQGERHSSPSPSRSPRATSCSHSPQLPTPNGGPRSQARLSLTLPPSRQLAAARAGPGP